MNERYDAGTMLRGAFALGLLVALLLPSTAALAQSGDSPVSPNATGYDLSWWTVDGGGTSSAEAGGYALGGTIGQPDAAVWGNGGYRLTGGFWGGTVELVYQIYLPLVLRGG